MFAKRIGMRVPRTFNSLLGKDKKCIQYEEKLANNKFVYEGVTKRIKVRKNPILKA